MKALIILFMLVSTQAFSQSVYIYQKVNSVVLYKTEEVSDSTHSLIFKFLDKKTFVPIKVNDTTWRIDVPRNEFTMILLDDKEWIGIKPKGTAYTANVRFTFDDGWMTVIGFNPVTKKYVDTFYGDLIDYKP